MSTEEHGPVESGQERPLATPLDHEVAQAVTTLETHLGAAEARRVLRQALTGVQEQLAGSSKDARLVAHGYRQLVLRHAEAQEMAEANKALGRLLKELGVATISVLPFAFVSLPAMFALARYFHIELLPDRKRAVTR